MHPSRLGYANLGLGVGLRTVHFPHILRTQPQVDWFEIISENFMDSGGRPRYVLEQVAERYPVVMHGVSLSIGSTDPLDLDYLEKLKNLADAVNARWVSDHLCWTGVAGLTPTTCCPSRSTRRRWPTSSTASAPCRTSWNGRWCWRTPAPTSTFADSTMSEWEFLTRLAEEADCGLLLDVNNVFVSSVNHDFDPVEYVRNVPHRRVVQFHLAGHTDCGTHRIDTHDGEVIDPVWELYRLAHKLTGGASTLLEWDAKIPEFPVVHAEVLKAKNYMSERLSAVSSAPAAAPIATGGVSNPVSFLWRRRPTPARPPPRDGRTAASKSYATRKPHESDEFSALRLRAHPEHGCRRPSCTPTASRRECVPPRRGPPSTPATAEQVVTASKALTARNGWRFTAAPTSSPYGVHARSSRPCGPARRGALRRFCGRVPPELSVAELHALPTRRPLSRFPGGDAAGHEPGEPEVSWPEFLADLARFEWTFSEVFDGPGVEGGRGGVARPCSTRRRCGPCRQSSPRRGWSRCRACACWRCDFPVQEYHAEVREENSPAVPEPAETWLAVTRRNYIVHHSALSALEYRLLSALAAGRNVGEAIAEAAPSSGADLDHLAANCRMVPAWGALGFFQAVELAEGSAD